MSLKAHAGASFVRILCCIAHVERYCDRWHSAYGTTKPRDSLTASDYLSETTTTTLTQTRTPTFPRPATGLLQSTKALHHQVNHLPPPDHYRHHANAVPPRATILREKATVRVSQVTHRVHRHRRHLIETKRPQSWTRFSRKKLCTRLPALRKRTTLGRNRRRQPMMRIWTRTMIYGLHWTHPPLRRRRRRLPM